MCVKTSMHLPSGLNVLTILPSISGDHHWPPLTDHGMSLQSGSPFVVISFIELYHHRESCLVWYSRYAKQPRADSLVSSCFRRLDYTASDSLVYNGAPI